MYLGETVGRIVRVATVFVSGIRVFDAGEECLVWILVFYSDAYTVC